MAPNKKNIFHNKCMKFIWKDIHILSVCVCVFKREHLIMYINVLLFFCVGKEIRVISRLAKYRKLTTFFIVIR